MVKYESITVKNSEFAYEELARELSKRIHQIEFKYDIKLKSACFIKETANNPYMTCILPNGSYESAPNPYASIEHKYMLFFE